MGLFGGIVCCCFFWVGGGWGIEVLVGINGWMWFVAGLLDFECREGPSILTSRAALKRDESIIDSFGHVRTHRFHGTKLT